MTREFGQAIHATHEDATRAVHALAEAHQGMSTEAMRPGWGTMSDTHVTEIVVGCDALAVALDAAAGYIVAQKAEAILVLIGMAAAFVADQAAAIVTAGIAEAAVPLIIGDAERLESGHQPLRDKRKIVRRGNERHRVSRLRTGHHQAGSQRVRSADGDRKSWR